MNWQLDDFIELESIDPGIVFGQVDCVCHTCNCPYVANYGDGIDGSYECPNCGCANLPN
jgi:hypothetical protein